MKYIFLGFISYILFSFFNSVFTLYSLFYIMLIYLSVFFILITFGFDFIALLLVLIYVGGILVLFLFVIFFFEYNRSLELQVNISFFSFNFFFKGFLFLLFLVFFYTNYIYFNSNLLFEDIYRIFIIDNFNTFNFKLLNTKNLAYDEIFFSCFWLDNLCNIDGIYYDSRELKDIFYYLYNYYITLEEVNTLNFYVNSFWKLGFLLYLVYFLPLFLLFLLFFCSMLGVYILTYDDKYVNNHYFNVINIEDKNSFFKFLLFDSIMLFNHDLFLLPKNLNYIFFVGAVLFMFNTFFLLFSKNLNIIKIVLVFELYFLSIILLLLFFSSIHQSYEGIIFIFILLGLMSIETILFLSIFASFNVKKLNFKLKKK